MLKVLSGKLREINQFLSCSDIVDQIWADPELKLRWYIRDTPERHDIKGLKRSGYHTCEMCLARGEWCSGVWWPCARIIDCRERTDGSMRETAR